MEKVNKIQCLVLWCEQLIHNVCFIKLILTNKHMMLGSAKVHVVDITNTRYLIIRGEGDIDNIGLIADSLAVLEEKEQQAVRNGNSFVFVFDTRFAEDIGIGTMLPFVTWCVKHHDFFKTHLLYSLVVISRSEWCQTASMTVEMVNPAKRVYIKSSVLDMTSDGIQVPEQIADLLQD